MEVKTGKASSVVGMVVPATERSTLRAGRRIFSEDDGVVFTVSFGDRRTGESRMEGDSIGSVFGAWETPFAVGLGGVAGPVDTAFVSVIVRRGATEITEGPASSAGSADGLV
jgi:hypothetical protein